MGGANGMFLASGCAIFVVKILREIKCGSNRERGEEGIKKRAFASVYS
jgi:hypothetical protein